MTPHPKKGLVKTIEIDRQEGYLAHWMATTFSGANRVLREWAKTAPKNGAYDKVQVRIAWDNGRTYQFRLDLKHSDISEEAVVEKAVLQTIEFLMGRSPYTHWTPQQYKIALRRYEEQIKVMRDIEAHCRIGDLEPANSAA